MSDVIKCPRCEGDREDAAMILTIIGFIAGACLLAFFVFLFMVLITIQTEGIWRE